MVEVCRVGIIDAEVVENQGKCDGVGVMAPEGRCVWDGGVAVGS